MNTTTIRKAGASDAPGLNAALAKLSDHLNDSHRVSDADIVKFGFGPNPRFSAAVAENETDIVGAILFSPVFSTTRGGPGLYISDLWVSETQRGTGLGRRLLQAACQIAGEDVSFLKLAVYAGSKDAQKFYHHLGFQVSENEDQLVLDGTSFTNLRGAS